MREATYNELYILKNDLFRGSLWIFLFYCTLIYLLGVEHYLYIFLAGLLLRNLSSHLCRNEINRAIGSLLSIISLYFIIPFSGILKAHITSLPDFTKAAAAVKLNSVSWGPAALQGVIVLILTILVCLFWNAVKQIIPNIKVGRKAHECILFVHRLTVQLFVGTSIGFLLKTTCLYLHFSETAGWILQASGCILPFLFIRRIHNEVVKELNDMETSAGDGPKAMQIPDVKLADVAGMEDVKLQLQHTMINPLKDKKLANHYGVKAGGGILLYGPPGNGKTFLAKAVAGELHLPFYAISSADIFSKYVGESERNIKKIFETIRKNKEAVLFIDELESIFRKRSDEIHETTRKIISLLLQELDGIQTHENSLLFIGATNTPWLIDEAFLRSGRFDSRIYVGLPDYEARLLILRQGFRDMNCPIQNGLLEQTAEITDGFCGADLKGISNQIKQLAFERKAKCCDASIFDEVLSHASPSVNRDIMQQIKQWESSI